ncbi:LLM class flavin-dependent oxidoreductase [Microbacterium sp. SORGH_AS_0344]|uniref:LLM class flavin-dependent oxidoreductase n=1 Tax=Microbacterium sp. SORGH_AS_0344 TaxID=3041767 RepID=UPI00278A8808|nr:LLM class flavin-dependent oxidoreductase [Microbacterium sp. SORGH_AS_0344]MDQ1082338.1 FMN-dependent oxidoreductase (nitrilotriacetate monooxygenase family) [Microbacterium sp. SORGH_AS_0344]
MGSELILNGFEMNTVSHINHGLWVHPDNRRHQYTDLEYWTETAQLLERGLFDAMFIADVVGTYDVYGGSRDAAVERGIQIPNNDPFLIVPAMAAVTRHLAFAVTASTTYEPPFGNARRFSTLDHLTKGRVAWNVVTGYLPDAARNFGLREQVRHDDRYELAEEFLDVLYKLWEGSWEADAVERDRAAARYTDPRKVHEIGHVGKYFTVDGPHLSEPSPQRTPVIYQAGSSGRGKEFAARNAEGVFVSAQTLAGVAANVREIRDRAEEIGRGRHAVRAFAGLNLIIGETEAEARLKKEELLGLRDIEGYLVHFGGGTGIDVAALAPGQVLQYSRRGHIESYEKEITSLESSDTGRTIVERFAFPERDEFFVSGTAAQVADRVEEIAEATGVDGFNVVQYVSPGTFADVVDLLVPELQRRGRYRTAYPPGSLRERLFGAGPLLPETHPAAAYRGAFRSTDPSVSAGTTTPMTAARSAEGANA